MPAAGGEEDTRAARVEGGGPGAGPGGRVGGPVSGDRQPSLDESCVDDLRHHLPIDVGEPEIAAAVTEREPFMIEAEQMQEGGVQIVHVDLILDGAEAELVRRAVRHAATHAAAGQPHGEAPVVMVAAVAAL